MQLRNTSVGVGVGRGVGLGVGTGVGAGVVTGGAGVGGQRPAMWVQRREHQPSMLMQLARELRQFASQQRHHVSEPGAPNSCSHAAHDVVGGAGVGAGGAVGTAGSESPKTLTGFACGAHSTFDAHRFVQKPFCEMQLALLPSLQWDELIFFVHRRTQTRTNHFRNNHTNPVFL